MMIVDRNRLTCLRFADFLIRWRVALIISGLAVGRTPI